MDLWGRACLTWIFMATSRPSFSLARCTCPMEAAAKGRSSNDSSLSLQLGPRSLFRAFCQGEGGRTEMKSDFDLTGRKSLG